MEQPERVSKFALKAASIEQELNVAIRMAQRALEIAKVQPYFVKNYPAVNRASDELLEYIRALNLKASALYFALEESDAEE